MSASDKHASADAERIEATHDGGTAHFAAERGHAATDKYERNPKLQTPLVDRDGLRTDDPRYGNALVHIDPKAEAKLRLKIDLMVVPTVSLLYLFCFIDRANIGELALLPC